MCFNEVVEYTRKFGHCHIRLLYKRNPGLGKWISHQRSEYKKYCTEGELHSKLDQGHIDRLDIIGLVWKVELRWNTQFNELVNYKRQHGNCNVSLKV